jgi:hypothetical protein
MRTTVVRFEMVSIHEQRVIRIHVSPETLHIWVLDLCLLREKLIQSLHILDLHDKNKLEIVIDERMKAQQRAQIWFEKHRIRLALSRNEFDCWFHFFLKYFRDGVAEVDHFDTEPHTENYTYQDVYVTLMVDQSAPAIPSTELKGTKGSSRGSTP